MEMKECRYYRNCESPICPLDDSTKNIAVWFKSEQICRNGSFANEKWRINQFRIHRNKRISDDNYFTLELLNTIQTINRKITGINPDNLTAQTANRQLKRAMGQVKRC